MKKIGLETFHHFGRRKEILLKMKLTFILLLAGLLQVSAVSSYSQSTKLTFEVQGEQISEVLRKIEDMSDFRFFYQREQVDVERTVNLKVEDQKIVDILDLLFAENELEYNVYADKLILLAPKEILEEAQAAFESEFTPQPQTIRGTVRDEKGEAVLGANIYVKGTSHGTISDSEGNYTITVDDPDAILVFSFVGFETQEQSVRGLTTIDIILIYSTHELNEVVAIGYGTMKKTDVTGAVGSVSSDKLTEQPSINPVQALVGKVAGVTIHNGSGRPGGKFRIQVRGMGSINASNDPLVVVDGVVGADMNLINTNDIETINILKDASATAIYGAQGANGVILITTKRAEEGRVTLSYDGSFGMGTLANKIDVLDANEFMEMRNRLYDDIRLYRPWEADNLVDYATDYPNLFNSDGSPKYNTDWQDASTQTAFSHRHYLSIGGSTDRFNSGLSIGYQNEEGILLNTFMEKTTGRFYGEYKMYDWLKFGGDITFGYTNENRLDDYRVGALTATRGMVEMPPIFPVQYDDGSYSAMDDIKRKNGGWDIYYGGNPVNSLEKMDLLYKNYQILGNFYLDFQLTKDLKFKTSLGRQYNIGSSSLYVEKSWDTYSNKNQADLGNTTAKKWQFENVLSYNKVFGLHRVEVLAGASWYNIDAFSWSASASEFADEYYSIYNMGLGTDPASVGSGYAASKLNSYFTRANYSYKDRYLATATLRYDGSSRFGENNKYAAFPSVALGWRMSEEDFLLDNNTLTYLKLRASFGQTGNNAIGNYLALGQPGTQILIFNNQREVGSSQGTMPNNDLKWETTTEYNIGIDLQFFRRIIFEMDYYHRSTDDLLYSMPVPQLSGYSSAMTNIGSTLNKGIEFKLETWNIVKTNFQWTTGIIFSSNKSEVTALGTNDADMFINTSWWNSHIMRVGEEMASFWGHTRLGTWGNDEADEAALYNRVPGDIKLEDVNGDYVYDIQDQKIIGNPFPDFVMNINNTFTYKNWELSFDIQISQGADIADASIIMISDRYNYANTYTQFYQQAWTPENQNTMRPRVKPDLNRFSGLDTGMLFDGSYIRGKNLILSYSVPDKITQKLNISRLRVYASAQNFFLITDYHGFDPEVTSWGNQFAQGYEMYGHPKSKVFNLGVNITF